MGGVQAGHLADHSGYVVIGEGFWSRNNKLLVIGFLVRQGMEANSGNILSVDETYLTLPGCRIKVSALAQGTSVPVSGIRKVLHEIGRTQDGPFGGMLTQITVNGSKDRAIFRNRGAR
ncbi:hypothetical protein D3C76_1497260 [compost metagenome]